MLGIYQMFLHFIRIPFHQQFKGIIFCLNAFFAKTFTISQTQFQLLLSRAEQIWISQTKMNMPSLETAYKIIWYLLYCGDYCGPKIWRKIPMLIRSADVMKYPTCRTKMPTKCAKLIFNVSMVRKDEDLFSGSILPKRFAGTNCLLVIFRSSNKRLESKTI